MDHELPVRITVLRPPPGVTFAVQRGKDELLAPSQASAESLVFDLVLRVSERKPDGSPNVLGPYAHGRPDDRFLYLNSGTLAGQEESPWTRRAKIKTAGIRRELVEQALSGKGSVLEARIEGRMKDGGPCCATVPLLDGGWAVRPAAAGRARR